MHWIRKSLANERCTRKIGLRTQWYVSHIQANNSKLSSYGECCIDDVTASHAEANDLIIHFGHCCLSTEFESTFKQIIYVLPLPSQSAISNFVYIQEEINELSKSNSVFIYADLSLI